MAEPEGTDPPTDPDPAGEALPPEQEARIIDKVTDKVRAVVEDIVSKVVGGGGDPDPDPEGDPDPDPEGEPTTAAAIETDMEKQVREALAKIHADDQHAADHAKLTAEPERPPKQLGRVTQALWGDRD